MNKAQVRKRLLQRVAQEYTPAELESPFLPIPNPLAGPAVTDEEIRAATVDGQEGSKPLLLRYTGSDQSPSMHGLVTR